MGEPGKQADSEDQESDDIEQWVDSVSQRFSRLTRDDQQLSRVEEDRVELHDQWQWYEWHELSWDDSHGVTKNNEAVMKKQFVGAPLPVVDDHVESIVDEVSNGETDKCVAGVAVLSVQIIC